MSQRARGRDALGAEEAPWSRAVGRVVVAFAVALVLFQTVGLLRDGDRLRGLVRGQPAPTLRLPTLAGPPISLEQWRGRVVLLEFWASWCPPCREKLGLLERLQDELGAQGLQAVTVEIEGNRERVSQLVGAQAERRRRGGLAASAVVYAIGTDAVAEAYRVQTIPQLVVIGRRGEVLHVQVGGGGEDELRQQVAQALTASAPTGGGSGAGATR